MNRNQSISIGRAAINGIAWFLGLAPMHVLAGIYLASRQGSRIQADDGPLRAYNPDTGAEVDPIILTDDTLTTVSFTTAADGMKFIETLRLNADHVGSTDQDGLIVRWQVEGFTPEPKRGTLSTAHTEDCDIMAKARIASPAFCDDQVQVAVSCEGATLANPVHVYVYGDALGLNPTSIRNATTRRR